MSVELGSVWIDNDSDLLVIVKSLEAKFDGKVTVIFNYIVRTGDKSIESASELELFLNTKTKLVRYAEKGNVNNKDDQNLNYRMGYNDGWHDCEASFELGNEFTDNIQEQAYEEGYVEGYNQHEYEVHQVMPESSCKSLRELSEQEFESIIDEAFEEGYAQAYSEIQSKTERERALQEKAWDEGYSQAISDVIDEDFEDGYSEYEFGAVEDDEEEYCFSKELDKILNGEFTSSISFDANKKDTSNLGEYNRGYEDGKSRGITLGYNKRDYEYSKPKNQNDNLIENGEQESLMERKHSHYFKDVRHLDYVDIYQVCKLFEVNDPSHCTQHSIKKLLMSGKRGAKDKMKDIIEARDTLNRYLQIEGIE